MKITASRTVEFPKLKLVFVEGEVVELPNDKEISSVVLSSPYIREVGEVKKEVVSEEKKINPKN